jgi:hypothetical protein
VLVAALLALLGSAVGFFVVSSMAALFLLHDPEDQSYDEETREVQRVVALGQLVGVAVVVGLARGPIVGGVAGLAAASLAWIMTPRSRALHDGRVMLVPAALGGALAAAICAGLID